MDRNEWLAQRRTGIGGSDAAAVLGMSKWKTPLSVWLDKTGQTGSTPESEPMLWGTLLEPVVRQEYAERSGNEVRQPDTILRHPTHPFMLANIDGVTSSGRLVEIKTARTAEGWGVPGTDEVPEDYLIQVQHYMAVTALPVADIAVLIGGSDFRIYTVPSDAELQGMMIDLEREFWSSVERNEPPPPKSYADVQAMFGASARAGAAIKADDNVMAAIDHLRGIRADLKRLAEAEEAQKAIIMAAMGECDTLTGVKGEALATWKLAAAPKRLDAKALAAAHPEIHAAFIREGEPSRRFLIKEER